MKRLILILVIGLFAACEFAYAQTKHAEKLPATGWNAILIGIGGAANGDTVQGTYNSTLNMHVFEGDSSGIFRMWYDAAGGTTFVQRTAWGDRYIMFSGGTGTGGGTGDMMKASVRDSVNAVAADSGGWGGGTANYDYVDSARTADGKFDFDAILDASGLVDAAGIATGAVGTSEIATGGVGSAEISTDAVGESEINEDAVGASEIMAGAIYEPELNVSNSATDNYLLSYNSAGNNFTWVPDYSQLNRPEFFAQEDSSRLTATDTIGCGFAHQSFTLDSVVVVTYGPTPDFTFQIVNGASNVFSSAQTKNSSGTSVYTTFADGSFEAGSDVYVHYPAVTTKPKTVKIILIGQ